MAVRWKDGRVEWEGVTLSGPTPDYSRFLMSDYGTGVYVTVWDGEKTRRVLVGDAEMGGLPEVTVDAPDALRAEVAAKEAAAAEAARLAREAAEREAAERRVEKGKAVVVVKGRKVPKGTKGVVRWLGEGKWGWRVGLAVEGEERLVYTALGNVEVDRSDEAKAAEAKAAEERAAWLAARKAEGEKVRAEAEKALPNVRLKKGDRVVPREGRYAGSECRVIWVGANDKGLRVGVAPVTRPIFRGGRPVWPRVEADWLPLSAVAFLDPNFAAKKKEAAA